MVSIDNQDDEWVEIGTIVGPQGLQGEVKVLSVSDFPERFLKTGIRGIQAPTGGEIREIELVRGRYIPGKNIYVIRLSTIDDRNKSENIRGYKLWARKREKPRLKKDEYHVDDLIGLEVYHSLSREKLGVVIDVLSAGNDLLEVRLERSGTVEGREKKEKTVLIPFVKTIVPEVDIKGKRLEITPPEGLLELNNP